MNNIKAKLAIVSQYDNDITRRFLKTNLEKNDIPYDKVFFINLRSCKDIEVQQKALFRELDKVSPEIVLTLGKEPLLAMLYPKLKKSFNVGDHVEYFYHNKYPIIGSYDPVYIINHTKAELECFERCCKTIKMFLFGAKND